MAVRHGSVEISVLSTAVDSSLSRRIEDRGTALATLRVEDAQNPALQIIFCAKALFRPAPGGETSPPSHIEKKGRLSRRSVAPLHSNGDSNTTLL